MTWFEIGFALIRRWWIFLPTFALLLALSVSVRSVGAEHVAIVEVLTTGPGVKNRPLEAGDSRYQRPVFLATVELESAEYRRSLESEGMSLTYEIDRSSFPIVKIAVRGTTYEETERTALRLAEDFPVSVERVQAERGADPLRQTRAEVIGYLPPTSRPAGSNRALAGLFFASAMLAGGLTYGFDQFANPARLVLHRQGARTETGG